MSSNAIAVPINRLSALFQKTGLITAEQMQDVFARQSQSGMSPVHLVAEMGMAREEEFYPKLAEAMNLPLIKLSEAKIERETLAKLPTKVVFQFSALPIKMDGDCLLVATSDPFVPGLRDALRLSAGHRIKLALCQATELEKSAKDFYGVGADTLDQMIEEDRIDLSVEEDLLRANIDDDDSEASVVKFVNQIIWEAHQTRATDIHMEPMETDLRIRYRVDGMLHETPVPPQLKRFQSAIISRIKVMAGMDISEKRLPQDGRISLRLRGEDIDVRVNTMPTVYGESVSLRLLMRSSGMFGMEQLGLPPGSEKNLIKLIHKPHGILLCTGPTGSGKSTSLYAWLHTINSIDKRIITVEDPIEYEMTGVNQVQIRAEIGLTFAEGLRNILRQDPDVIMVGEIRDRETAEIAIRAALTGHLVFSTLHTNDSAGACTRLIDMGIEPYLVASSVEGIVAQRLVRRLCDKCRRPASYNERFLQEVEFPMKSLDTGVIYEGVGCKECRQSGFNGRTGIYEILTISDALRPLIIERASANQIKAEGLRQGMHTLRDDGWRKVLEGTTTVEEVLRVSEEDEREPQV